MQIFIKETAKRHGVSVQQLADRLGVTRQTVNYYCQQGDKNPVAQLERIAQAIGCEVEDLFTDRRDNVPVIVCPQCGAEIELTVRTGKEAEKDGGEI